MTKRYGIIVLCMLLEMLFWGEAFSDSTAMESLVWKSVPEGWALTDAPETFTRETLFERIDGQAELFFQYGFKKSVAATFRKKNTDEDKIDLDIYEMADTTQAFGIFSRFRQEESPAGIGLDSSLGDRYALLYKGKFFVILQATESHPATLKRLAEAIDAGISDNSPPPKEIAYFPGNGLKPGAIQFFPDGLLGYEFLKRGFKAAYVEQDNTKPSVQNPSDGRDFYLFLSISENSEEAMNALKLFRENLSKTGKVETEASTQFGPDTLTGVDPYQGKIIVAHKGIYLAGVVGFEHTKEAVQQLVELIKKLN